MDLKEQIARRLAAHAGNRFDQSTPGIDIAEHDKNKYRNRAIGILEIVAPATELQTLIDSIPADLNWLIGKGKTRPDEPAYGAQILRGLKVIAEAENDDLCSAIRDAVALIQPTETT